MIGFERLRQCLNRQFSSIKTKVLIRFEITVLLLGVTCGFGTALLVWMTGQEQVFRQMESVATLKEEEINAFVRSLQSILDRETRPKDQAEAILLLAQSSPSDPAHIRAAENLSRHFIEAMELLPQIEDIFLLDERGHVLISSQTERVGDFMGLEPFVLKGLEGPAVFVQNVSFSGTTQDFNTLVAVRPIQDAAGAPVGLVGVRASMDALNIIMKERSGLSDTGETYLVGDNYTLITPPHNPTYALGQLYASTRGIINAVTHHLNGSATYKNYADRTVLGVYRWLPELRVALMAEQERSEAFEPVYFAVLTCFGITLAAMILAAIGSAIFAGHLTDPILRLAASTQQVSRGDPVLLPELDRPDEIGEMSRAFSRMTGLLGEMIRSLETDVQERLEAEKALRLSEEKYRRYVDHAPIGVIVTDLSGRIVEANSEAGRITGYAPSELFDQPLSSIVLPVSKTSAGDSGFPLALSGSDAQIHVFFSKSQVKGHLSLNSVRLPEDRILHLVKDVTFEQKEENARRLESLRREAMLHLHGMVGRPVNDITDYTLEALVRITDSHIGYIAFLNDREDVLTMYSWSKTAMNECRIKDKPQVYLVEATGLWGEAVRQRQPIITNDYAQPNPFKKGYPEGHVMVRRHMNVPIFDQGKIVAVAGVGNKPDPYDDEDVLHMTMLMNFMWSLLLRHRAEESLRESEMRYRTVIETTDTGFVVIDATDGRVLQANENYLKITGRAAMEEILGRTIMEWTAPHDLERNREALAFCRERKSIRNFIVDYLHPSGQIVQVEINATLLESAHHSTVITICRDVTDKRLQDARLQQQQKLESIGTLAGGVAHEINNPINIIMNYGQLILDTSPTDSQIATDARAIIDESKRIAHIVANLLSFSRQEKERHSPADINEIIRNTLSLTHKFLKKDQIFVDLDLAEDLPLVKCRSQQIMQVLMNLFTNARDALNEKFGEFSEEKRVLIRSEPVEMERRRWVRITVRDSGNGIPREIAERIFDPFFTTKPKDRGTGLGLSISHGLVKDHHGHFRFESEPGRFTSFVVELPVDNGWSMETSEV